jgi:ABC-2 type transport system ATP-binding protein/lipopolysaccharide transport system ATP-binding protein
VADEPAIVVDHVSKKFRLYLDRPGSIKEAFTKARFARYEDLWALQDVSFEVQPGSVYGLVGHNGSGKSSLLRLIAGIQRPTEGRVETHGRISALLELGAGFHPELTGRENVYLNASILGIGRRETDAIFDDIVEFAGLAEFIDSPVKHYSSGMFVRLGFAVAVHVDPQILIVDEVIAVGDEEFQRRCFDHLFTLRQRGVTILFVTHSLDLVRKMCDRAAWLDHGVLRAEGPANEVVHSYLAEVNEAEAVRLDEQAEAERVRVTSDDDRHRPVDASTRPIVIERVEVLDQEGQPTPSVSPLDPATVRIHWTCIEPVDSPLFSFSVDREGHLNVATPGMYPAHRPAGGILTGTGHVDYRLELLPLGPGTYELSAAIHDQDAMTCFDKREAVTTLRVRPGEKPVFALVDLMGRWSSPEVDVAAEVAP